MPRNTASRGLLENGAAILFAIGVVVLLFAVLRSPAETAPMPPVFERSVTLARAIETGIAEDKPVLAFATATWCGPCQAFKNNTLADAGVASLINERFVTSYIDVDERPGEASQLNVSGIPHVSILRDGKVVARNVGNVGPDAFRRWLEDAANARP